MPKYGNLWLAASLAGGSVCAQAEAERALMAPPVPGLVWALPGGLAGGPAIEVMRETLVRAGLSGHFLLVPWARAIEMAAIRPANCVLGLAKSQDNLGRYRWAGPIIRQRTVLWARAGEMEALRSRADIGAARLGAVRGTLIARELAEQGYVLDLSANDETALRKLMAGRIDLLANNERTLLDLLASIPQPHPRVVLVLKSATIGYVACHPDTPSQQLLKLDQAIAALKREGRYQLLGY